MPEMAQISIEKIPEPGTEDMVTLVHNVLESVLFQLPFPFMSADVMSAATVLLIDAVMVAVMEGKLTKEELADEICGVIRKTIEEWQPHHSNVTSPELMNRTTQ